MIPSPIRKVLSSLRTNQVQSLLMGGQACILYGAAEFSRDVDLAVLADAGNLARLSQALSDLQAVTIAVPPFEPRYLEMGLAVHFRCAHPEAKDLRIDVMSKLRGVADFGALWSRRTTVQLEGEALDVLSLPDLVQAKKTQRDKDWPMIARLVEASYFAYRDHPGREQVVFWLRELRTPDLLLEVAARFANDAEELARTRPLLWATLSGESAAVANALRDEQVREQEADREYWRPLRVILEQLRHGH